MNIFYLDSCPIKASHMQCDLHVVKMVLESAQLLCTAHRENDGDQWADENNLYKSTHKNHPSAVWTRATSEQYRWLYDHFYALCDEYRYRYGKEHLTWRKLGEVLDNHPSNIGSSWSEPPQCMPDQYKVVGDSVTAYQNYYRLDKSVNDWFQFNKSRPRPSFLAGVTNG